MYETRARGHPHLVDIRHIGAAADYDYYVMELADGYQTAPTFNPDDYEPRTIQADLQRRGPYRPEEAVQITRQALDGLAHLHHCGLLHRDIKPANIVFVDGAAKLADIGLVR